VIVRTSPVTSISMPAAKSTAPILLTVDRICSSSFPVSRICIVNQLKNGRNDCEDIFSRCKAEDAGGLAPGKDDNVAARKIDRKHEFIFELVNYIYGIKNKIPA